MVPRFGAWIPKLLRRQAACRTAGSQWPGWDGAAQGVDGVAPASETPGVDAGDLNMIAAPNGMEQPKTISAAKSHAFSPPAGRMQDRRPSMARMG